MSTKGTTVIKDIKSLDEFSGWDNNIADAEFFGEAPEPVETTEAVIEQVATDDVVPDDKKKKPEEEVEKAEPFFGVTEEDETETTAGTTTEEDDEDDKPAPSKFISALSSLKEKGIIDYELEEGQQLTEEEAENLLEDKFEEGIEARVGELLADLPEFVKDLSKYAIEGGDVNTFLNSVTLNRQSVMSKDMDLTNEDNQILIMKETLKAEGYDDDYIDTNIDYLKDAGKLESISQTKFDKWNKDRKAEEKQILKQQSEARANEKKRVRNMKSTVLNKIKENKEIGGIPFSTKDARDLPSYMADKTVKLKNGSVVSQMQGDLLNALANEDNAIILAKLLRSDFDFKTLKINTKTKVVEEVRKKINDSKSNTPIHSGRGSSQQSKKGLTDYF